MVGLQAGPFSLHIRERDQLVTLFIPLGDIQTPSLAAMADWPVLQLSRDSEQSTLLWCREWLDKLDVELLIDLVSRMLHQAEVLTCRFNLSMQHPFQGSPLAL
ncbi:hypothetical protein [Aeromonas salmonicida]|uniref:hypothetical protein n=1 Tax=Aeromonas salmonicida TaxID=645 RepID=UPI00044BF6E1|nr:hypothetical protein [Aeromonas salmonicida]MDH7627819.1 hypothetical protein [Aeromonas salmonicida]WCH42099.1 hypothetical protein ONZ57_22755 [Aeromonas salmonicida]WGI41314.1 hypothetical protein QDU35_23260 [Aeromonas salmonicida]GAJ49479.1 hypothetical protein ASA01S_049_00450 [Aeromonas salmonicida subsp. masoucida NBRC 13784]